MRAKCGPRVVHHWAHARPRACDPWWENETPWHREWKNLFPPHCREVTHTAPDGEIHRADIKTPSGIYVEVQHSSLTDVERRSREAFYQNILWVLDGRPFCKSFHIGHKLPHPESPIASDLVWARAGQGSHGANAGMFFRVSEAREWNPAASKGDLGGDMLHEVHPLRDILSEVEASYRGHHQYFWVRPRQMWLEAGAPVFLDFGQDWLARLLTYDESGLPCVYLVSKRRFVHDAMTASSAFAVGERGYSQPGRSPPDPV